MPISYLALPNNYILIAEGCFGTYCAVGVPRGGRGDDAPSKSGFVGFIGQNQFGCLASIEEECK
jgi:hypothetical protein